MDSFLKMTRENQIVLGREGGLASFMNSFSLTIRDAILLAKGIAYTVRLGQFDMHRTRR